ncbi:hypothetical protein KI387_029788, partial [Taxus chinensis]
MVKVYIYLKTKLVDGRYIENDFKVTKFPRGKHTIGTLSDDELDPPCTHEEEEEDLKEENEG